MTLESIAGPKFGEKHPWTFFLIGAGFSVIALILSAWLFPAYASAFFVFFVVLAATPLFYNTLIREEEKDNKITDEMKLAKEHYKAIRFLMFLFFGIVLTVVGAYIMMPADKANSAFAIQSQTINSMNAYASITGNAAGMQAYTFDFFLTIFFNNFKVMLFILLFSLIFGVGAIFIISWNASIIGVALGNFFREKLAEYVSQAGLIGIGSYLKIGTLSIARYAIHGIPEIAAYFITGLAGGIISVAIIRKDLFSKRSGNIMYDVSDMIMLALVFLFVGAIIETYITPSLYL